MQIPSLPPTKCQVRSQSEGHALSVTPQRPALQGCLGPPIRTQMIVSALFTESHRNISLVLCYKCCLLECLILLDGNPRQNLPRVSDRNPVKQASRKHERANGLKAQCRPAASPGLGPAFHAARVWQRGNQKLTPEGTGPGPDPHWLIRATPFLRDPDGEEERIC